MHIKIILISIIGLAHLMPATADERLKLLKDISDSGAPALTQKMMDQAQPDSVQNLFEWVVWEQDRLAMLTHWRQWDALLVRLENLPLQIPKQFEYQAITFKANAYLELGQTTSVRETLREYLWDSQAVSSSENEIWRRQIIYSYLKDGRNEDARVAMMRFHQDFKAGNLEWELLRARVLIEAGRQQQAVAILKGLKGWKAKVTSLLAKYQLKKLSKKDLWSYVEKRRKVKKISKQELVSLWGLAYAPAKKMSSVDRVIILESIFRIDIESPLELLRVSPDLLWRAYLDYAKLVGNKAELFLGDDQAWLDLAKKSSKKTPIKTRSLLALLMSESIDAEIVEKAAKAYMKTFKKIDLGEHALLQNLFAQSGEFSEVNKIPAVIRYRLADLALKVADIDEATRLMSGLNTTPKGYDQFKWSLRKARVLILGGRYHEGNQVLEELLVSYIKPDKDSTDKLLHVLFDLQAVELHEQVISHFNYLLRLEIEPKQRREILYWIADSYKGLEKFDRAALLYLQSAMLPGPKAMDEWAQTARYNAAESLKKAGLIDDARRIYQFLLDKTKDKARRSLLSHNIQQLWLTQAVN